MGPRSLAGRILRHAVHGSNAAFFKSVSVLAGGTALAQAVLVLSLPILTRLYTPSDFNLLAVYVSCVGIASVSACLRLDIAIPIPPSDDDAMSLLVTAVAFCTATAGALGLVVATMRAPVADLLNQPGIAPYLWLLPASVWFAGCYSAMQYWATRQRNYHVIARTRLTQAVGGVGTQISGGLVSPSPSPLWLLVGQSIAGGAGFGALSSRIVHHHRSALRRLTLRDMRRTLREYRRFPTYSATEAILNTAASQAPLIIVAALAIGPEAGYLMLAMRVMQAPMALLGAAVAQVYLAESPAELRAGTLGGFTSRVLGGLTATGVGPLILLGVASPRVFGAVFGSGWDRAGDLVFIMTPWVVFQLLSSPVSMVMHVRGRQRAMLVLTVMGIVLRLGSIVLAAQFDRGHLTEYFIVSSTVFYAVSVWLFSRTAGVSPRGAAAIVRRAAPALAGWTVISILIRLATGIIQ